MDFRGSYLRLSMPNDKGKSESAGAGASVAVAGTGLGVTEAESFSGGDIARMLGVISAQLAEGNERLGSGLGVTEAEGMNWGDIAKMIAVLSSQVAEQRAELAETREVLRRLRNKRLERLEKGKCVGFGKEPTLVDVKDGVGLFDITPGKCLFDLDFDFDGCVSFQNDQEVLDNIGQDACGLATERDNSGGYTPCFVDVIDCAHLPVLPPLFLSMPIVQGVAGGGNSRGCEDQGRNGSG